MKKDRPVLLVLGGAEKTLPLVRSARSKGIHVLLCDQNENSPCRPEASEFARISTTDIPALRMLIQSRKVDGVVSFGSDLMAVVAAQLADEFGIPGNPPYSVEVMARKDLFRDWLRDEGFAAPRARSDIEWQALEEDLNNMRMPLIFKPVDAAGSTGVSRVDRLQDAKAAFDLAKTASRDGRVIVEQFIERDHPHMIGGDLFVQNGEVVFWGLLNSHRANLRVPFLPTGTSYPLILNAGRLARLKALITAVVKRLGLRFGGLNVEAMFGRDGQLYLIELAPRNGGNAIPELLERATGYDLIGALIDSGLGNAVVLPASESFQTGASNFVSNYMLHSNHSGCFDRLDIATEIEPHVSAIRLEVKSGDAVEPFDRAVRAIGWLDLSFQSMERQESMMSRMPELARVVIKHADSQGSSRSIQYEKN